MPLKMKVCSVTVQGILLLSDRFFVAAQDVANIYCKFFIRTLFFVFHVAVRNKDCVKKNRLDARLIFSMFRQPLPVSGVSRPIISRYNRMYTTNGTYYSF
jgi:hypothetical protein